MITLLGKSQIRNLLTLMLYRIESDSKHMSVLIEHIKQRASIMLFIAKTIGIEDEKILEKIEFIGFLSMMDVIFKQPLVKILYIINVELDIKKAIIEKSGKMGQIYELSLALENNDRERVLELSEELGISDSELSEIVLKRHRGISDILDAKIELSKNS
jgi:EAL and modified HD-GYP domain-containing signal transduction protein